MTMSSGKNVVVSGLAALGLAVVILVAAGFAGMLPIPPNGGNSNTTSSTGGTPGPLTGQGTLSILATDPPQVPDGVSAISMAYDSVAVHSAGAASQVGWIDLGASGTVDSLSLVNVTQTVAVAQVAGGSYDMARLRFTSVSVTFNGSAFAADIASDTLTATIMGGIQVNSSRPSAALIDIMPTLLNTGTAASPHFVLSAICEAFPISSADVSAAMMNVGFRGDLLEMPWWAQLQGNRTASIQMTGTTLTSSSLQITVKDTGNAAQPLRFVVVTPLNASSLPPVEPSTGYVPVYRMPPMVGSYVFSVQPDGSLALVSSGQTMMEPSVISPVLNGGGYSLSAAASVSLSYSGPLNLGGGVGMGMPIVQVSGQYQVTVIGDTAQASVVVASG